MIALSPNAPAPAQRAVSSLIFASSSATEGRPIAQALPHKLNKFWMRTMLRSWKPRVQAWLLGALDIVKCLTAGTQKRIIAKFAFVSPKRKMRRLHRETIRSRSTSNFMPITKFISILVANVAPWPIIFFQVETMSSLGWCQKIVCRVCILFVFVSLVVVCVYREKIKFKWVVGW